MATNEELDQIYDTLVGTLRGLRLDWVVEEVEGQVALGKLSMRKVRPAEFSAQFEDPHNIELYGNKTKGQAVKFVVSEEYSPRERLIVLLDAIESAVVQTLNVARHITFNDTTNTQRITSIEFFSEQNGENFRINQADLAVNDEAVRKLAALIVQLRQGL